MIEGTPLPDDPEEAARWEETHRKRRMMEGTWTQDLMVYTLEVLNADRATNLGRMSRAVNLIRSLAFQIGPALYDSEPTTSNAAAYDAEAWESMLASASVWQMAPRHGAMAWALREQLWFVSWSESSSRPVLRSVPPDEVVASPADDDPARPVRIEWLRRREVAGKVIFAWDVWDVSDPDAPVFFIRDADGEDITASVDANLVGMYPWKDDVGAFLPWVLTHAEATSSLFDPFTLAELSDLTFDVGVLWNLYHHVMRDASWRQKFTVDLELGGNGGKTESGSVSVTTSPTSVANFRSTSDRAGTVGSLDVAVDVEAFARAVLLYARSTLATLGIHPADVETTASAESGVAISLKRSAQRREAMRLEPQYRRSDEQLLSIVARVSNLFGSTSYPVDGWQIVYAPPTDSVAEREAAYDFAKKQVADGLLSRADWYRLMNPSATLDEAREAIALIEAERGVLARIRRDYEDADDPEETPTEGPVEGGGAGG